MHVRVGERRSEEDSTGICSGARKMHERVAAFNRSPERSRATGNPFDRVITPDILWVC
ncbi:hypothetical protein WN48_08305 [Eufriesea mexicana]|uniref:Uncharacterized protein n=1 Tax=Eufriesea mexicana TaxID=516756 RepID=A0A310SKR7_9HYME|nr:hypothetical protein WN48_08305 [Eufriesea mexicana]